MTARNKFAGFLVALGASGLLALAVFHLKDYWKDTARASSLSASLHAEFRAIFLLVGWQWIVVAVIAMLAAFTQTKLRPILLLLCGVDVLVEAALTLVHMGLFLGTELMGAAAILFIGGGLLFRRS